MRMVVVMLFVTVTPLAAQQSIDSWKVTGDDLAFIDVVKMQAEKTSWQHWVYVPTLFKHGTRPMRRDVIVIESFRRGLPDGVGSYVELYEVANLWVSRRESLRSSRLSAQDRRDLVHAQKLLQKIERKLVTYGVRIHTRGVLKEPGE